MKFMIHSCNSRKWYVDDFLVPALTKQGINESDIYVYNDDKNEGNLVSWVVSCHKAYELWGVEDVWHLQDDVVPARYFKETVDALAKRNLNIICGFICKYDEGRQAGEGTVINDMWYSFPCIRLNSALTKQFAVWADNNVWKDHEFGYWIRNKKGDDLVFRVFLEQFYPTEPILNLNPNIVDHVDYLIGGTTINNQRPDSQIRSIYWRDEPTVVQLMKDIEAYKNS